MAFGPLQILAFAFPDTDKFEGRIAEVVGEQSGQTLEPPRSVAEAAELFRVYLRVILT